MCQHRVSPPKSHKVRTRWPSYRTSQPGMSSALSEVCRAIDMCTRRTQGRRAQDRASALGGNWKHDMPPTQQHLGPSRKRIHAWKSGYALIARPCISMATTTRRHQRRLPRYLRTPSRRAPTCIVRLLIIGHYRWLRPSKLPLCQARSPSCAPRPSQSNKSRRCALLLVSSQRGR